VKQAPRFLQGGAVPPRPVLWVIAGLSLTAGVLGYCTGSTVADLSETEAIRFYAQVYAAETGGALTDCAAVPGTGAVWLVVRCSADSGARTYRVDRRGGLIDGAGEPSV